MENRESIPVVKEGLESSALSDNSKISEIFELCLQPKTKEDLEDILLNFRDRIKDIQESEYFGIFDYICMYVLDYIYKHDTASFCAVSRSLYLYQMLDQLVLKGTNRNLMYNCDKDCLLKTLRHFVDLHTYSKKEEMLVDVGLSSILAGHLGLALYLIKFGLIEFPSEVNEKCRKMFEILVGMFNSCSTPLTEIVQADDMETSIRLDELLSKVKENNINIRRSILTFCILTVVVEYNMYEKLETRLVNLKFYTEHKKDLCLRKLGCIFLYIEATTETIITFKDIQSFTEVILNSFISAEIGKSLMDTSRKILGEEHDYYNPRSLKDLARFKIRSSFRNSMSTAEQVNELDLPVALKEFLNFHTQGIWELLLINHLNLSLDRKLNRSTPETEDGNEQAIENRNVQEFADGNLLALENENVQELPDGNVQELPGGFVQELPDGNVQELAGESMQVLVDKNVQEVPDDNVQELAGEIVQELVCENMLVLANKNEQELPDGNVQQFVGKNMQLLANENVQELADGNMQELED